MTDTPQPPTRKWQRPAQGGQPPQPGSPPPEAFGQPPQPGTQPQDAFGQFPQPGAQPQDAFGQFPQPGVQPQDAFGQFPQPGAQQPQPFGQFPQQGAPFAGPGFGQPTFARPRRRRRTLLIAGIVVVLAVAGVVAGHVIGSSPRGSISLPGKLLNLPRATSSSAKQLESSLKRRERAGAGSKLLGVTAGVYGSPTGAWFAIAGGGICGTCTPKSADVLKSNLIAQGYTDAATFSPGAKGGSMACGSETSQGITLIRCTWVDNSTAGDMLFSGGSASGPADAAAKTNQVRAIVEH